MTKVARVTVAELLNVFRGALVALVPFADRAHIPWRDADAYDDWDAIAEALYRAFVETPVNGTDEGSRAFPLPRYNHLHSSYADRSRLWVLDASGNRYLFFGFSSKDEPFDVVRAIRFVPGTAAPLVPEIFVPLGNPEFELELVFAGGVVSTVVREIELREV
jgi:hypothetical protein